MSIAQHQYAPLEITPIISALREARVRSLERRQREQHPPKLPSKKILNEVVEGLATVLYPNRLGAGDVTDEGLDYFVGNKLDETLRLLYQQIQRELRFEAEQSGDLSPDRIGISLRAHELTKAFAKTLPYLREVLDTDLEAAFSGDPAAHSVDEVLVCYPGMSAMTNHRIAHELYHLGLPLIARVIAEIAHSATGIDIHPGAQVGKYFFMDHGTGVVIGETSVIGQRVRLYQAVTLGAKRFPTDEHGLLVKGNARHPIIQDDVVIYAGATVLGRITIGQGSTIGGNVWVTRSVPPNSNVTQAISKQELYELGGGI